MARYRRDFEDHVSDHDTRDWFAIRDWIAAGEKFRTENFSLVGDIVTARIIIDDGAHFKGSIEIGAKEFVVNPPES